MQQESLTEHHLQPHQTPREVVEVDGHVGVGVTSHQQLVDGVVEREPWRSTTTIIIIIIIITQPLEEEEEEEEEGLTCVFEGHSHLWSAHRS